MENFTLVFSEEMLKQLKQLEKERDTKERILKMFGKIEEKGSDAGKLLDYGLALYEVKSKRPPIRLYFRIVEKEARIFRYEMKTSAKKQQKTIDEIRENQNPKSLR
ncbi:MAG TPA: hypothetical protein VFF13_05795 [archaeon]|nr:hypothetical protein [archaeon]